ncbi:glutamate receptor ionotropic, kainate glr-3-like [Panulirus ornatus]|uniref:glutamate receptor ionotropic, kainate glr-3-like n=1 Tax=Panulirus ornatus TaxID=150431 RepID=UPI003A8420C0
MMGMMQRKEVDLAVGPFGVTYSRSTVADFSIPIMSTDHAILYRRPQLMPDLLGFTKPFTLPVWAGVLASLVLVTLAALLFQIITSFGLKNIDVQTTGSPYAHSYQSSWLWSYMVLLGQAVWRHDGREGDRVLMGLWVLVSLIIAVVYRSNLKAMLIVPRVRIPFDSLEELVNQDEMTWTFPKGSIVHSFFEAANAENPTSTMGRGWEGRDTLLLHPKSMIPTTLSGVAGLFTRHSSIYMLGRDFSEVGFCRLTITRQGFMFVQYSMGFPLGSTLKPAVDSLIYRLKEFGLLERFLQAEMGNTSYCLQPPGREDRSALRPLAVEDFHGVYSLYAAGVVGSFIVFLVEVACVHSMTGDLPIVPN